MSHIQPLLDEIENGFYDTELLQLKAAIERRQNVRRFGHTTDFSIGDRVVIQGAVRPKLLVGKTGIVASIEGHGKVAVQLDVPVRRWVTPICPVSVLASAA